MHPNPDLCITPPQILNTDSWVLPTSGICALSPPLLSVQHRPPKLQSYHKAVSLALLSKDTQSPQTSNAPNYSYSDHLTTAAPSQSTEPTGMSPPFHSNTPNHTLNSTSHPTSNTPSPLTDTPSPPTQLSTLVQTIPTFEYLIQHWSPPHHEFL